MSIFENDIVLPGVFTEIISDYSSGYDTSLFGTTDAIAVIGTAFNGPVGKPFEVYSPEHARYVFGSVYDSTTRKEATLVANIQDAWDRGCRTIYAVRVSGKDTYKDYQLSADTNLKLRVSGLFPSNSNKNIYMTFNNNEYAMSVSIFKPAKRATISEKNQGLVENQDSILENVIDLYSGGITKEDSLTELISRVNEYTYNNVIRLSIVDQNGNDVTLSSIDAKSIRVGDMFPGLYTIGRSSNVDGVISDTRLDIVIGAKPYNSYEGSSYNKLTLNTNVAMDIPIFSENGDLNTILGISSINQYDFLKVSGKIDEVFEKDSIDYEEVNLTDFDLYKKLGKGFAINSQIVEVSTGKFKVKEVTDKANKKTELKDGLYSMLENLTAKYRVLSGAYVDSTIKGKLPKNNEFKFAKAGSVKMFNDSIKINSIIDKADLTMPKNYTIKFEELLPGDVTDLNNIEKELYVAKTIREATGITFAEMTANKNEYKEGSLFLVSDVISDEYPEPVNLLYVYSNNKFTSLHKFIGTGEVDYNSGDLVSALGKVYICSNSVTNVNNGTLSCKTFVPAIETDFNSKDYAVSFLSNGTFVIVKLETSVEGLTAISVGTVNNILDQEKDEKLVVAISSNYNDNNIVIKSNQFDYLTIDEIAEMLNSDPEFTKLFSIETLDITKAQDFISEIKNDAGVTLIETITDRTLTYDTTLLIPFRTDDNFGRHLAQHCMYTSLKTSPTHGIMGVKALLDMGLEAVSSRVKSLIDLRLNTKLVAKKDNGTDMLDLNNMPYPIGRKLSVIVAQYQMITNDNYTFVSNGAAGYAGMISCLPLDQSSTCQSIKSPDLIYEFTNYQLSSLTGAGFVTIKKSYTKGWVITDGITMATSDSPYRRLSASRIADGLEDVIRNVCEPYIGKQNHLANQNSLRSAIKSELDKLKNQLIENYDFKLLIDKSSTQLGIINIEFSVVPIYEIKAINNQIKVTG